jgi:DNA polymerase III delta subunit
MEIKFLKNSIKSNLIPNFLIFVGEEQTLARQYIESISNTLNKHFKYYDSADEVLYETSTNLREDFVYIILNDGKVLKNVNYVEEFIKTKRNIILYYTECNLESDLFNKYRENLVNFKKLDKYTILAYLVKKLKDAKIEVEQSKLEQLVDYCNCNLGICLNELDKIIVLSQTSSNMLFDYMIENGFSDYRNVNIYKFIQKIINKDKSVFKDLIKLNESSINVITLLYKNIRKNLESSASKGNIDLLRLCYKLDCSIKDGTLNGKYVLDYLLLKVL